MILTHIIDNINQMLPEPHASLLAGMLFGVKVSMPRDFYNSLITTGTVHLVALSGMNVSIIIGLVFNSLSLFTGKRVSILLSLLVILGFVLLVGSTPSIVRASIMGSLTLLASFFGRKPIALLSLCIAGGGMLLFNLSLFFDVSFQLSFLATLGIILFAQKESFLFGLGKKNEAVLITQIQNLLLSDLRVTLAAQLFTLPVIFWHFREISFIAPIANVAVGWLVPFIMYAGILFVFLLFIFKPLAYLVGLLIWVPLTIFIYVITLLSRVPFASVGF